MVNARNSHGYAYSLSINPEGWRTLAGDNIPGNHPRTLRPGGSPESTVSCPIRPICRVGPILSQPKSTLANPKSTVDLGCEPLIKVENSLISTPSRTAYRPISTQKIKGFSQNQTVTNRKKLITSHCYGDIPQDDPQQKLASKALPPICVNSRNSRKKLCVFVEKRNPYSALFLGPSRQGQSNQNQPNRTLLRKKT